MDTITASYKAQFDDIIASLHSDLDVRASQLFQLHVSELNKVASNLASGSTLQNRSAPCPDVPVPQRNNPGLNLTIEQRVENQISAPGFDRGMCR